jgi:hypothetical protein
LSLLFLIFSCIFEPQFKKNKLKNKVIIHLLTLVTSPTMIKKKRKKLIILYRNLVENFYYFFNCNNN